MKYNKSALKDIRRALKDNKSALKDNKSALKNNKRALKNKRSALKDNNSTRQSAFLLNQSQNENEIRTFDRLLALHKISIKVDATYT